LGFPLQAFIALLYRLEKVNNFKVRLEMLQKEFLLEPPGMMITHRDYNIQEKWVKGI